MKFYTIVLQVVMDTLLCYKLHLPGEYSAAFTTLPFVIHSAFILV